MQSLPASLQKKLDQRREQHALRSLGCPSHGIDFHSNDYLGLATNPQLHERTLKLLHDYSLHNGATGSRLISGNHALYASAESHIAAFHQSPAALIFNSGYDANLALLSSLPQKNDVILYDALAHASLRDGMKLSPAHSYKFAHNNLKQLETLLQRFQPTAQTLYVVTESIFSMDGDGPDLTALVELCERYQALLILDEAHALGVVGAQGEGLAQALGLHHRIFVRLMTYGKAAGVHGAAVLGSEELKSYLVNFARPLIYSTALPPHSVAAIYAAYQLLPQLEQQRAALQQNIAHFRQKAREINLNVWPSNSAIQAVVCPGNDTARQTASALQQAGFDLKAILAPTVPAGTERLRICLHAYNTPEEINRLLLKLQSLI